MVEIWKDIKGYENKYKISNLGRVMSFSRKKTKILKPILQTTGYYEVTLSLGKSRKQIRIHRLVAEAFIPNPENKEQVNHIDGNKNNNCMGNLEWSTSTENNIHAYKTGLNKGRKSYNNTCSKQVLQYDLNGNFIKEWGSTMDIERELNISNSCISAVCLGVYKQSHGFVWKYKNIK